MKSDVWRTECELLAPEIASQMYNLKLKNVAHKFSQFHFFFPFPCCCSPLIYKKLLECLVPKQC